MRIAVLWVVLVTGAGVFVVMLHATRRHRAHATTFAQPNATKYVWVVIPWLIAALCVAPAVHRVLAAERDGRLEIIYRLDPNVSIEDTVGAIAGLIKHGYLRHIGLSEVRAQTIRLAQAAQPIADLQIEYSLISGIEHGIVLTFWDLGIEITAFGAGSQG